MIKIILFILILLSSCVILRKKKLEKSLEHIETNPKTYCFSLKMKISDILFVKAKIDNQVKDQNFMFDE